ncbi:Cytochrome P450 3A12 [Fragariocoptes setiger]|uniref:Cytochrome P450 3A12 n=1 Tax=Fragariocoptes setiger TaxID=1670756 RepID=A0ABQ7S9Y1_9ACAR|nr:Cytochrome P450 3A12 [Fragariocoptes setiger]
MPGNNRCTTNMSKIKHPDIQQDLANASSALCNYIERRAAPKTCINVVKLFKRFTADVVMRVSFEHSNEIDYESNSNTVLDLLILLTEKIYDPKFVWFQYIPLLRPVALMLDRLTTNYRGRVVKLAEHSLQDRTVRTSLPRLKHKLLDAYDQQRLTDKELIGNTSFFLAAAWDTTAQTLTALMWLLAKHPNEQIRLRDDIVRDGPQSKYLEYCIKETLRLYPPALTARELSTDIEWNGMRLRKGMMLTANVFTLHRSVKYWGHDSDLFRPERFVPEHCKHFHKSQFFAFGMGPRNCVGGKLAMCQMQILVSRILVNYEIELCPSSPELLDVYTPMLFVPMIKGPVELNFIKRAL